MNWSVSKEIRCPDCGEVIYFWTRQENSEPVVEIQEVHRRCHCPIDLEALATEAKLVVPELVSQ